VIEYLSRGDEVDGRTAHVVNPTPLPFSQFAARFVGGPMAQMPLHEWVRHLTSAGGDFKKLGEWLDHWLARSPLLRAPDVDSDETARWLRGSDIRCQDPEQLIRLYTPTLLGGS
jgi:hypothetical protein